MYYKTNQSALIYKSLILCFLYIQLNSRYTKSISLHFIRLSFQEDVPRIYDDIIMRALEALLCLEVQIYNAQQNNSFFTGDVHLHMNVLNYKTMEFMNSCKKVGRNGGEGLE